MQRVLVLNMVEISKDFLILLIQKTLKQGLLPFRTSLLLLKKHFVHTFREHFKSCAHLLTSYEYLVNRCVSCILIK